MSIISEKSPKHCAEKLKTTKKKLFFYVFTFFLSILSLMLIIWLIILHQRIPNFSLKQAHIITTIHHNSSIHITLLSTNPNNNAGIYYDGLSLVHASYNGSVITPPHTSLPSFFQHHKETKLLNASLPLPPPPPTGDQVAPLELKVSGRLRWKVGTWVSRRYAFNVDCATLMAPFRPFNVSTPLITSSKQPTLCSTSISRL